MDILRETYTYISGVYTIKVNSPKFAIPTSPEIAAGSMLFPSSGYRLLPLRTLLSLHSLSLIRVQRAPLALAGWLLLRVIGGNGALLTDVHPPVFCGNQNRSWPVTAVWLIKAKH